MIKFLKKYFLSIFVILIIFILCFMDTTPLPAPAISNFDKYVHVIMFLILSGVVFFDNTYYLRFPISKMQIFWSIFLFPAILAGLIEIMQEYLTTTRFGDWLDFLFGVIGTFFGLMIALSYNRYILLNKQKSKK